MAGDISPAGGRFGDAGLPWSRQGWKEDSGSRGMTLHSNDKRLRVSPGVTHSYGLFEVCGLISEVLSCT